MSRLFGIHLHDLKLSGSKHIRSQQHTTNDKIIRPTKRLCEVVRGFFTQHKILACVVAGSVEADASTDADLGRPRILVCTRERDARGADDGGCVCDEFGPGGLPFWRGPFADVVGVGVAGDRLNKLTN